MNNNNEQNILLDDLILTGLASYILRDKVIKNVLRHVNSTELILDAGCGRGIYIHALENYNILGIDVMVSKSDFIKNKFIIANVCNLPFKAEKFDCVLFINVLHLVSNYQSAIKEMTRVLKTGGILIIVFVNNILS